MPAYEIEVSHGKGPQLFSQGTELVAPDMLCFTSDGIVWIEAKHKTRFTWYRKTRNWLTGVDLRHYNDYLHVSERTDLPVWLLFYHRTATPSAEDLSHGCPEQCPTGLFGGDIKHLAQNIDHECGPKTWETGHGSSGMVYWAADALKRLAPCEDVQ